VSGFANDYVEVAERVSKFFDKYPDGSIQADEAKIVVIGERSFITVRAYAYRNPEDPRPGVAQAWEPYPGKTSFTRDSEAMNAETSAVGRALGLLGIASKRSIATKEDVQRRRAEQTERVPDQIIQINETMPVHATRPESLGSNGKWLNEPTGKASDAQIRKVMAQLKTLNVSPDRQDLYVSDLVKRDVRISQLSKQQAMKLIDHLTETIAVAQKVATGSDAS
jgi:hypothetical protein